MMNKTRQLIWAVLAVLASLVMALFASLSTQLTTIEGKVDAIKAPPMIG